MEQAFRDGTIRFICATPTLAAGMNLPAYRVIIRDLKRFGYRGMDYIPVLEVQQMCLPAGEEILLPNFTTMKIEDIIKDESIDKVLSYNIKKKEYEPQRILKKYIRKARQLIEITTNSGNKIKLTPEHPILLMEEGKVKWVAASKVRHKQNICTMRAPYSKETKFLDPVRTERVTRVKKIELKKPIEVYNLGVSQNEDFVASNFIIHNCGRAGRPAYDTEGEAIILPKNKAEADYALENYIRGEPEKVYSKLGVEPVLRMHVLALIASGTTPTRKDLMDFFFNTLYAHQYKDLSKIEGILTRVIKMLRDYGFVEGSGGSQDDGSPFKPATQLLQREEEGLKPTLIGRRVAELYLDPITANKIIRNLKEADAKSRTLELFPVLHMVSNTLEMRPLMNVRKKDQDTMNEILANEEQSLLDTPPNPWDIGYEDYLRAMKTAYVISMWAAEAGEDKLLEDHGVTPGELRAKLDNIDWLLYATQELALLLGFKDHLGNIRKIRLRVKYGVRGELLPLVRLKGIGRTRARKLFSNNIRSLADLRKVPVKRLSEIIGPKTADQVKDQLGENDEDKEGKQDTVR
ncbi:MAG: hypothetical protein DRO99_04220 [Candidatus Aenigmatarchaeota archaeon]|nr:MAG: hypothetical protein DRO99_04220 [Candidatus Aenigmarchaeota archaeon]